MITNILFSDDEQRRTNNSTSIPSGMESRKDEAENSSPAGAWREILPRTTANSVVDKPNENDL